MPPMTHERCGLMPRSSTQSAGSSGLGALYVVSPGRSQHREFDAFPMGSDWAPVSSSKPQKIPASVAACPALLRFPRPAPTEQNDAQRGTGTQALAPPTPPPGLTWIEGPEAAVAAGYGAEEDEEERKGRMAVRIQRAWRTWWRAETGRRACTRIRLWTPAR
jgi:hypothetical protein